jgi:hypothetical protein
MFSLAFMIMSLLTQNGDTLQDTLAIMDDPMSCGVSTDADGIRRDRMTRWAPGDPVCMFNSIDNAYHFAHEVLWRANGGAIYGANVDCRGNLTADSVPCLVDVTDKNYKVRRKVWIACESARHCGHYGNTKGQCCKMLVY